LTINGGCYETYNRVQPPTTQPQGCAVELAELAKKAVNIPIITTGKAGYPELAETILREGKADFIGLARYLLADPEWANKLKEEGRKILSRASAAMKVHCKGQEVSADRLCRERGHRRRKSVDYPPRRQEEICPRYRWGAGGAWKRPGFPP